MNKEELLTLPLLPLRDMVLFPHMVAPLFIGRERSVEAIKKAMADDQEIFLSAQKDAKLDEPGKKDIYKVGTIGTILQLLRLPDGTVKALIEGKKRAEIKAFVSGEKYFVVEVNPLE